MSFVDSSAIKAPSWSPENVWGDESKELGAGSEGISTLGPSKGYSFTDAWETGSDHGQQEDLGVTGISMGIEQPLVVDEEQEVFSTPDPNEFTQISLEGDSSQLFTDEPQQQQMDDFGDFGDENQAGDDDDFGDFGTFEDQESIQDFSEPPPILPVSSFIPSPMPFAILTIPVCQIASTSKHPLIPLDVSSTSSAHLYPQIQAILSQISPLPPDLFSTSAEEADPTSTLPTASSKALFKALSEPPNTPPLNWKRSRTRRSHLIALGIPVNLDELSTSTPLQTLVVSTKDVLPGGNGPMSAPATKNRSSLALQRIPTPTIDRGRCSQILDMKEEDIGELPLDGIQSLKKELEGLLGQAGELLTNRLEKREKLTADSATYDLMIQVCIHAYLSRLRS